MFASLRSIDLVVQEPEGPVAVQTDDRPAEAVEATWALSVVLATARALNPKRLVELPRVRFVLSSPPSPRYRALVQALGAEVWHGLDGERWPAAPDLELVGREGDEALRALGRRVLAATRPGTGRGAAEALEASYAGRVDRSANDAAPWWTAVVELSAAIGELLAAERPGRWVPDPGRNAGVPWMWATGEAAMTVMDRVLRFFEEGASQRPSDLWTVLEEPDALAGRQLVRLQPAEADTTSPTHARPLLPGSPGAPCWSFVRDRPRSRTTLPMPPEGEREALWAEATAALAAIRVAVVERQGSPRLLVVHGDEYAAEKLLDPTFLLPLGERLGARRLWGAVPVRGSLWLCPAGSAFDLDAFAAVVDGMHEAADLPHRLCPAVLLLEDGRPTAVVRAGGPPTA